MPMNELHIPKKYAYIRKADPALNNGAPITPMLRVFRCSPDVIDLQIRTCSQLGVSGRGVRHNMLGGVSLTVDEARQLRTVLNDFIAESTRTEDPALTPKLTEIREGDRDYTWETRGRGTLTA